MKDTSTLYFLKYLIDERYSKKYRYYNIHDFFALSDYLHESGLFVNKPKWKCIKYKIIK